MVFINANASVPQLSWSRSGEALWVDFRPHFGRQLHVPTIIVLFFLSCDLEEKRKPIMSDLTGQNTWSINHYSTPGTYSLPRSMQVKEGSPLKEIWMFTRKWFNIILYNFLKPFLFPHIDANSCTLCACGLWMCHFYFFSRILSGTISPITVMVSW